MPASNKMTNCTSVFPVPPSKTNQFKSGLGTWMTQILWWMTRIHWIPGKPYLSVECHALWGQLNWPWLWIDCMVECATQALMWIRNSNIPKALVEWRFLTNRATLLQSAPDLCSYNTVTSIRELKWNHTCWMTSYVTSVTVDAVLANSRHFFVPTLHACNTTVNNVGR